MDPYLEMLDLWPEVHSRLIVAIADALDESLSDRYRIAIEKRVYQSTAETSLAIGAPDVVLIAAPAQSSTSVMAVATPIAIAPITIELPMQKAVQERYLEVREARFRLQGVWGRQPSPNGGLGHAPKGRSPDDTASAQAVALGKVNMADY